MNPIENLWDRLERAVHQHKIKNLNHLWEICQEEWKKITAEDCQRLVENYASKRLKMVLDNNGYHIPY